MAQKLKEIHELEAEMLDRAEKFGLTENYIFVTTWKAYKDQLQMAEKLRSVIAERGYTMDQPCGKDQVKLIINPAVAEYNRIATLANKTATQLLGLLEKAEKSHADDVLDGDDPL